MLSIQRRLEQVVHALYLEHPLLFGGVDTEYPYPGITTRQLRRRQEEYRQWLNDKRLQRQRQVEWERQCLWSPYPFKN